MKRTLIPGLMLLAAFTLTNCSEQLAPPVQEDDVIVEETPSTEATEEEILGIPFEVYANASDEEVDTKTTNDDGGNFTAWEATDAIYVYHAPAGSTSGFTKNHKFSMRDIEENLFGGALESNTVLQSNQSYDWYFIYPNNEDGSGSASTGNPKVSTKVVIGAEKGPDDKYVQNVSDVNEKTAGIYYPMYGKATTLGGQNPKVKMKHLSSLIALKVVNQGDSPKEYLTRNRDGNEKKIVIKELTFSVPSVTATGSDGKSGTQTSLPIVGAFTVDITGNPVYTEIKDESSHTITLKLPRDIEIDPGADATFYLAVRPFTADSIERSKNLPDPILEVTINGSKRQVTIPADKANFEAGKVTTLRVPVKLSYPKASDGIGLTSLKNSNTNNVIINGETVPVYSVGDGQQLKIEASISDLINAVSAGFYIATLGNDRSAMTIHSIDLLFPYSSRYYFSFLQHDELKKELSRQILGSDHWLVVGGVTVAIGILFGDGIERDSGFLSLTKFIDPRTIIFNGIIDLGAASIQDNIIILDEEPIYKALDESAFNNLLSEKFTYNGEYTDENGVVKTGKLTPTFQGLRDIVTEGSKQSNAAISTSIAIYYKLLEVVEFKTGGMMTVDIPGLGVHDLNVINVVKSLIPNPAALRNILDTWKCRINIQTYPYYSNKDSYVDINSESKATTKASLKDEDGQPIYSGNPMYIWGVDITTN